MIEDLVKVISKYPYMNLASKAACKLLAEAVLQHFKDNNIYFYSKVTPTATNEDPADRDDRLYHENKNNEATERGL
jgi:sulfur relay (sulfurtransferase) complex TusBCD TusD component (DsrE family)